jgi:hypothetical protein
MTYLGSGIDSSSIDPEQVCHVPEVLGVLFESGREPSHILHLAEEAFDDVPHGVEVLVVGNRVPRIALGWDDRNSAFSPANISIIGRGRRALPLRKMAPGRAGAQDVENPVQDPTVISTTRPAHVRGQQRLNNGPLFVAQIKMSHHHLPENQEWIMIS